MKIPSSGSHLLSFQIPFLIHHIFDYRTCRPLQLNSPKTKNPSRADEVKPEVTMNSRKLRPTGSTHFGDVDFEEEEAADIGDATWAEVGRACCVHSRMEWGKIFLGVCAAFFFLYFFLFSLELLGNSAKVLGGCTAGGIMGKIIPCVPLFVEVF